MSSLYIWNINLLSDILFAKIFSHLVGCLFVLLIVFNAGKELFCSVQFSPVTQSCPALCDPMYCSMLALPVHHQLPESTQIHVHQVGDAIQPSHLLSSPSPPALNLSQHQGLSQWVSSLHKVAKVLEFQLQISPCNEHSGLISFRMNWLDLLAV